MGMLADIKAEHALRQSVGAGLVTLLAELDVVPREDARLRDGGGTALCLYLTGQNQVPATVPFRALSPVKTVLGLSHTGPDLPLMQGAPPLSLAGPAMPPLTLEGPAIPPLTLAGSAVPLLTSPVVTNPPPNEGTSPMSDTPAPISPATLTGVRDGATFTGAQDGAAKAPVNNSISPAEQVVEKQFNLRLAATVLQMMAETSQSIEEVADVVSAPVSAVQSLCVGRGAAEMTMTQVLRIFTSLGFGRIQNGWTPVLTFAPPAKVG